LTGDASVCYNAACWVSGARHGGEGHINKELRVNEQILRYQRDYPRVREVRLIDENGEQVGIVNVRDALEMAKERNLDLIEVAPQANPPVCRIMDYGRYKYQQAKREREAHKRQKGGDVKGVRLRPGTDDHDFNFKVKNALKFLQEGDKVKVTVQFKSREITHPEFGRRLLDRVVELSQDVATVEKAPTMEGRIMTMILAPKHGIGSPQRASDAK
jgi:translation initiation factor IF-3